jgi:hypothetical protein
MPRKTADPEPPAIIVREGDTVRMPVEVFDDMIARLLAAEGTRKFRSWWKPW